MSFYSILNKFGFISVSKAIYWVIDWRKPNRVSVREFIREQIADAFKRQDLPKFTGTQDEKMLKILKWVKDNITYVPDKKQFNTPDYWTPIDTLLKTRKGDCEDGAILIYAIAYVNGVNPLQLEFVCGDVKGGGHAWIEYAPDEFYDYTNDTMKWFTIDWCYWYDSKPFKDRVPKSDNYYKDWFRLSIIY